ncbi:hypothetical protein RJ640_007417 [Escallonia rubra]|uniref:Uncharacterized protein n=1 Tax=Escallonia rubra TaxID=112253 RepID=A0AA88UKF5_9ASTE|nr:hypothetical protein RJ640_007417 [Escallonia rubra]
MCGGGCSDGCSASGYCGGAVGRCHRSWRFVIVTVTVGSSSSPPFIAIDGCGDNLMMHYAHSFGWSDAIYGSHVLLKDWCSQEKKIWLELELGTQ